MPSPRRHWLTDKERDVAKRLTAEARTWQDNHVAKHGPHTCTPDPADPWSTCHLITEEKAS